MTKRIYTEYDYIQKCVELGVIYVGHHSEPGNTMIDYICPLHKNIGIQSCDWAHFKNYKNKCPYCSGRYKTNDEFHNEILNQNIIFLSEYHGAEKPLKCMCGDCGCIWITNRPIDLKRRNGCPNCAKKMKARSRIKSQEEFEQDLYVQNPEIKIIGPYLGSHKYIKCQCLIDGYTWSSYACNLLNGSAGCPICNNSIGENRIIQTLIEFGINYTTQKTFPGCNDIKALRFDVYDNDNNICFEFQGEQHYYPIDFSGNGKEYAQQAYEDLKRRDAIKENYCNKNGILLVCIPYWERDNVKDYILDHVSLYKERSAA